MDYRTPVAERTPTSTKTSTAIRPQLYCTVVGGTHSEAGPTATRETQPTTGTPAVAALLLKKKESFAS